jgi:hypothetical protein
MSVISSSVFRFYFSWKFVKVSTHGLINFFLKFLSLFTCAEWVYIVTFVKVLMICQIYHTLFHPFHHSPSPPHSWNSFNIYHFSTYTHVYTVFAPYSFSFTFHYLLSIPMVPTSPRQDLFHLPVLLFCIKGKVEKNLTFLVF